jgi:hypothetical protein
MKQHKEFPGFTKEYSLEKKDGKWAVVNTAPSGASHGMPPDGEGSMPPGHAGAGAPGMMQGHTPTAGMGEMPPGHPAASGANAPGKFGGCPVAGAEDKPTPPAKPAK